MLGELANAVVARPDVGILENFLDHVRVLREAGDEAFDVATNQQSPGLMVIGQDDPFAGGSDDDLQTALVERASAFGKPVVLVHGDSHVYRLGTNWPGVPNLIELQTFAVDNTDRWVEVTVDPADPGVFRFAKMQS